MRTFILLLSLVLFPACGSERDEEDPGDVDVADYTIVNPDGTASVLVCHVQSSTAHEIEVGFSAVRSHLSHGDFLGPCQ